TSFYLHIWEDFRDFESAHRNPHLFGFKYCLRPGPDPESEPLFRYECHPEFPEDLTREEQENGQTEDSHYGIIPHFHPYSQLQHPIPRLHFLFHRCERNSIIFAFI